ncbi:MAG: cytochrome c biogenesis protein CcsA [Burkholderiaceae bacterium]|jgi:ABC-type uncharacterized transport system permease subunit|nr:cytochrome c biogenesis protein CcsA [Aquabacterium sp.]NUP84215.1 cytochrome c biogenesis protein CcsA [Burkholderiaceae bacterium]
MILASGSAAPLAGTPLALALAAALAYGLAAWPAQERPRWVTPTWVTGWLLHAVLLAMDITGLGRAEAQGARLGFGPVLSLTVWLVIAVHAFESRLLPLPAVRRALAVSGAAAVLLAWAFPGEMRLLSSPWAPLHWVLGVGSYALFGAAVLHASMLDNAERQMRRQVVAPADGPLGLPLLRLERLTFRFVEAGFGVLTLALLLGFATARQWRWDHKSVFSLLGWGVFAALLVGRQLRGWRGRQATRWLYLGTALLLLAYVGSRFVFEVILGRPAS